MNNLNFNSLNNELTNLSDLKAQNLKKVIERAAHLAREQKILLLEVEIFENDLKRMERSLLNYIKIKGNNIINK